MEATTWLNEHNSARWDTNYNETYEHRGEAVQTKRAREGISKIGSSRETKNREQEICIRRKYCPGREN